VRNGQVIEMPRVKYAKYTLLDGSTKELVHKVADGSIITRFDKTPVPEEPTDVFPFAFVSRYLPSVRNVARRIAVS